MSSLPQPAPPMPVEVNLSWTCEAAWIIDLDGARVVAASPAGGAMWGGALRQGVALDRAMPAVQDLIRFALDLPGAERPRTLLIWTARGPVRQRCRWRLLSGQGRRVLVTAVGGEALEAPQERAVEEVRGRAALAHELRTPLSAIAALAEVMKEERLGPMGNEKYLVYSRDIQESARHALDVLAAMLRNDSETRIPDDEVHADVDEVVARSFSVMRELARRSSVRLEADLLAARPHVSADSRSLMQILINLISNALRFTPPGGAVTVQTGCAPDGSLALSVIDHGAGMSRGTLQEIEAGPPPFAKTDSRQTGHGLPIVRTLAEASGARVEIASAPGEGTRVSIVFPPERVLRSGLTAA